MNASERAEIIEKICTEIRSKYVINESERLNLKQRAENKDLIKERAKQYGVKEQAIKQILFTQ